MYSQVTPNPGVRILGKKGGTLAFLVLVLDRLNIYIYLYMNENPLNYTSRVKTFPLTFTSRQNGQKKSTASRNHLINHKSTKQTDPTTMSAETAIVPLKPAPRAPNGFTAPTTAPLLPPLWLFVAVAPPVADVVAVAGP